MSHLLALYATALLLGVKLFFSFVVAPMVFANLPPATAAGFMRAIFPLYYAVTIALALLALLAFVVAQDIRGAIVLGAIAALGLVSRQILLPRIEHWRPGREAGEALATTKFRALHRVSVLINMAQMLGAAGLLFSFVL
ncbi:DUF4149 domain-containing protein [Ferrovibrio sp.]|uniref:DUF4149 domain-containing protein n=1 Tax=Ferrovibrio sp. TaxID=1917215 RepID=UPI00261C9735|nr:DUF4149 domain-containing protein [Ferrovibrio sp.]